jgi:signal-transduction protein with cAMP-binding, CBS, and nucleotidyltransferase domain
MSVTEYLQHSELFSGLTPEQVERIVALGHEVVYNAGDAIIREGDPSDEMYIVCSGMVEVEVSKGAIPDVPGDGVLRAGWHRALHHRPPGFLGSVR